MSESDVPSSARVGMCLAVFQVSAALKAAIELDLFVAVAEGNVTVEALASRCQAAARGVRILADYLVMNGFLTKHGDSYDLAAETRYYLDRRSPHYLGAQVAFQQGPYVWGQFGQLSECVRRGGARSGANALDPNHEIWATFARVMVKPMESVAQTAIPVVRSVLRKQGAMRILDVAASHGMFGITFAKEDPTCQVVALDWPEILEVTREHVAANGLTDRFTFVSGSVLEADIGDGYDVVLIPNLLHYLDRATNVAVLKKVRAAMKAGGVVAIVEYAPNDDRISPQYAAFALFVLAISPTGDAYTVKEIWSMCAEAGFKQWGGWETGNERLIIGVNG
jgi:hypothetical protein